MPPAPSSPSISYGPSRVPGESGIKVESLYRTHTRLEGLSDNTVREMTGTLSRIETIPRVPNVDNQSRRLPRGVCQCARSAALPPGWLLEELPDELPVARV